MKNIDIKLHYYQKELIKKLTLSKEPLKFNELQIEGLSSEHMNYHLKQLLAFNFVKKTNSRYTLTDKGKDVVFFIFLVKDFSGDFIEETPFQENFWATKIEIEKRNDLYDDFKVDELSEVENNILFEESIKEEEGY